MTAGPEEWADQLRRHGYRITAQRELILQAIQSLPHPNQESILDQVRERDPSLNRTTVYRTLALLERLGLVEHAHIGTGAPAYHLAGRPSHIHLRCVECGTVVSVPQQTGAGLVTAIEEATGFDVDLSHTALAGVCRSCRSAAH